MFCQQLFDGISDVTLFDGVEVLDFFDIYLHCHGFHEILGNGWRKLVGHLDIPAKVLAHLSFLQKTNQLIIKIVYFSYFGKLSYAIKTILWKQEGNILLKYAGMIQSLRVLEAAQSANFDEKVHNYLKVNFSVEYTDRNNLVRLAIQVT